MTPPAARARVVVCQHRLLHYRRSFFDRLRDMAAARGLDLHLVVGQGSAHDALRHDQARLPWADEVHNRIVRVGGVDLVWQPFPRHLRDADLVVLMQENRILSNYPWLLRWRGRAGCRVAYWGHGRNLQSRAPDGWRERWKRAFVGRTDAWFAYTASTRAQLLADGVPDERITVLDNAIDDEALARDLAAVDDARLQACRTQLGAGEEAAVALFCGSLYADKRLDRLLQVADRLHDALPAFRLVVIGDGPERPLLRAAAVTRPWLLDLGALHGVDKAAWYRVAQIGLNPGAVGLNVLDAFGAGLPLITSDDARHGPEFDYLRPGVNACLTAGDPAALASEALRLLRDGAERSRLAAAARQDAQRLTLAAMVQHFVDGIERCLATPPRR